MNKTNCINQLKKLSKGFKECTPDRNNDIDGWAVVAIAIIDLENEIERNRDTYLTTINHYENLINLDNDHNKELIDHYISKADDLIIAGLLTFTLTK